MFTLHVNGFYMGRSITGIMALVKYIYYKKQGDYAVIRCFDFEVLK